MSYQHIVAQLRGCRIATTSWRYFGAPATNRVHYKYCAQRTGYRTSVRIFCIGNRSIDPIAGLERYLRRIRF
jgi:hypothetical protein